MTSQREHVDRDRSIIEQRFRLLVESVRDHAICMLDTQGDIATWNASAERLFGWRADETIGRSVAMLFSDDAEGAQAMARDLAEVARDGNVAREGWRRRKDGGLFEAAVVLSAMYSSDGTVVGYAMVVRDLSQQRLQEHQLVQVAELSPSALLLVDARGCIVLLNAQAEAMFGYARDELLGRPVEVLLPRRLAGGHAGLRGGFMQDRHVRRMGARRDLYACRKDGSEFPVEVGLGPIDTPAGPAALASIFDISERQRQSAEIQRALAEKETLLREVYHRVKNNLQVVQSLLNLQRRSLPEGAARSAIDDTAQRVRAMALVHEKLYQSGNLGAVSLADYTAELLRQIGESNGAGARGIELTAHVLPRSTGLDGAVPYGLLLNELVVNSLKHGFPEGRRGTISVWLTPVGDALQFIVRDDGVGLPSDAVVARSTSMGLRLARSLAAQLGGALSCASTHGGVEVSAVLTRL